MSRHHSLLQSYIASHQQVIHHLLECQLEELYRVAQRVYETLQQGGILYLCGNGGSAADAQHIAAELIGRFHRERPALAAVALVSNPACLTALGNDFSFPDVFARQVECLLRPQDLLVAFSTSGQSENILRAVDVALERSIPVVAFTGFPGEPLASKVPQVIRIASSRTSHVQEGYMVAWHGICELLDEWFLSGKAEKVE